MNNGYIMEEEELFKKLERVIITKDYVYDTGEVTTCSFTQETTDNTKAGLTEYRTTQLISSPWKPNSQFIKMYTGGTSVGKAPQFKTKSMAQEYLNILAFIKPETNSLGKKTNDLGWVDFDKNMLREGLKLNYKTFNRFYNTCLEMNILSEYGRNNKVLIYVNPLYIFNGRNLHINLCLAFDHDDRFIKALSSSAKEDYLKKKDSLLNSNEIIAEIIDE